MEDLYFNFVYQPYLEADTTISDVAVIGYEVTSEITRKEILIKAKVNAEQKTLTAEDALRAK